jgi:hypothetical protein
MTLEEAAARVAEAAQPPAAFEDLAGGAESRPTEESPLPPTPPKR